MVQTYICDTAKLDEILAQLKEFIISGETSQFLLVKGSSGNFTCPSKRKPYYEMGSLIIASDAFTQMGDQTPGISPLMDRTSWTFIYTPKKKTEKKPEYDGTEPCPSDADPEVE